MISASTSAVSGVVSAGLSTTVLPHGQRRRDLPGRHQQREVPRDDLPGDAERPRVRAEAGVARACRPSRRSRRSAPPRSGCRRRATRGSACRCRATRARPARGRAPGSRGRCGTGTWPARAPGIARPRAVVGPAGGARPRRRRRPARPRRPRPAAASSAGLIVLIASPRAVAELAVDEDLVARLAAARCRATRAPGRTRRCAMSVHRHVVGAVVGAGASACAAAAAGR